MGFTRNTLLAVLALACTATTTHGYAPHGTDFLRRKAFGTKKSPTKLSPPTQNPGSSSSSEPAHKIVPQHANVGSSSTLSYAKVDTDAAFSSRRRRKSSSTGGSFPGSAHGMLSPEMVERMDENIANSGSSNPAVENFLRTYRLKGPMSCLEMLSDPEVLPHLTRAMRDIA